ncbi:PP2C family protein-serine/threonine phosphatase [Billgrantia aerodenitrificans]|uniref:SpoIIE family protein phosphatase n=1 Tax=Billgrantia aerodenitrificans TaxID=2733483 RepID=A0ABS9AN12_9GAMM|nr:protein phosphatase 2C domain-containing protein [Halomonas aerodenitrificans]MCE8023157.1 SpoIIE family protein phosphatase [Halomonas aerodenitrificans]
MRASWFSQQGRERARNSDAAAVSQQDQYLLAVLVDGAEKGPRGAELARHWADVVLQVLAEASARSPAEVHARLKQEHAQLRHGFLRDIASYCMVSLDLKTLAAQIWHCGDCRVGLRRHTEMRWLTTPHILAQQPGLPPPRSSEEQDRHEQQLTRCLNARHFRAPDYHVLSLQQGQVLLLSTDGYWQEHLEAGTPRHSLRDDASLLTLPVGFEPLDPIDQASDSDNLRHFQYA